MNIHITARHFKAHTTLRSYAFEAINSLEGHFDGILNAHLILSYEKEQNSIKAAELIVKVQGTVLKALKKTTDYHKAIDKAIQKMERQLQKHKSKQRKKQKAVIRTIRAKN